MVSNFLEHLANLSVASLMQCDFEPGIVGLFDYANLGRSSANALFRIALLSNGNSAPQSPQLFFGWLSSNFDQVCFGNVRGRLHQLVGERAVVGQQQQALAVEVEASDRVQASLAVHKFHHRGAALGIGDRGYVSTRLIQNEVLVAFSALEKLVVDAD